MTTGIQFRGTLQPNQTQRWFTFNWPAAQHVIWTVVPDSISAAGSEVTWSVAVQRASAAFVTYWISVSNQTSAPVDIEGRYAIVG